MGQAARYGYPKAKAPNALLACVLAAWAFTAVFLPPRASWGLASNNIPLDSPIYLYIEKLSGFGLLDTDVNGLKPYSKAEAARLLLEAEGNLKRLGPDAPELARGIARRLRELVPREADLYSQEDKTPALDWNPLSSLRARYVYMEGTPRSYDRLVADPGNEGIFGIGSGFRQKNLPGTTAQGSGSEGTPLLENNEGVVYEERHNYELKAALELYVTKYASALVEPLLLSRRSDRRDSPYLDARLNKAYLKLGGKGLELEVGRDENWFGQGFRGATVLTNNAKNLDIVKLSSPEPIGWEWLRESLGEVKYAVLFSRLEESGAGKDRRRPWFAALKVAAKMTPNFELGVNVGRQAGGPNLKVSGGLDGILFGGKVNDGSNFAAGVDFRYRMRFLRNTVVYFEYAGEDSASFWPFVESYVAGFYAPMLTSDGKNDLRFEFYYGNRIAYVDYEFPEGYTNENLILGHSQGGDTKEYFTRFTHHFSERNRLSFEYFHTQRGRLGRVGGQAVEEKDAGRLFWNLPVWGDWDALLNYGYEDVRNFNLIPGERRRNHLFRMELTYRLSAH